MAEVEIEFKNLLTEEEYEYIYDYFNLGLVDTINNYNYYYDDARSSLKNNNSALRIRHTNDRREITLKVKSPKQNLEYNCLWSRVEIPEFLEVIDLPEEIKENSATFNLENKLLLTQKIETRRKELQIEGGLLVLDKNYFLGNIVDYELEFEVKNYEEGYKKFSNLLKELKIDKREALPKIARAANYSINKK